MNKLVFSKESMIIMTFLSLISLEDFISNVVVRVHNHLQQQLQQVHQPSKAKNSRPISEQQKLLIWNKLRKILMEYVTKLGNKGLLMFI